MGSLAGGCPGCDGDPRPVARRSGDRAHGGAKLPTPERGDDGGCAQKGGQAGEPDEDGGWRPWAIHRRSPRWGPSRTPRDAIERPLRFVPRRLYPHRGPRLVAEEHGLVKPRNVGPKTTETTEAS